MKLVQKFWGGVVGGVTGTLIAGPGGAIIGGASGPLVTKVFYRIGAEIKDRLLGKREKQRIGATLRFALQKIQENIKNGREIRQDSFFQKQPHERSGAEEILEGILLVAQREHEEKKLRFYGNLFGNLAFHSEIDRAQANLLIRIADQMSYRQICLLAIFKDKNKFKLRKESYPLGKIDQATRFLLQEVYEIYSQHLLDAPGYSNRMNQARPLLEDIVPAKINLIGSGVTLYELMELQNINANDLKNIVTFLT